MTDFRAQAVREEGGLRLSVSDNAVSLLTFAMMGGHPQGIDVLLASLASGVVADKLRPYLVEAMEALDIPPTEELVESMVKHEMDRLDAMVQHGVQRGPLMETGRDDIGITVVCQPVEFYLLTLTAMEEIPAFEGPSEIFLTNLAMMASLLTAAEKMSLLGGDQKPEVVS